MKTSHLFELLVLELILVRLAGSAEIISCLRMEERGSDSRPACRYAVGTQSDENYCKVWIPLCDENECTRSDFSELQTTTICSTTEQEHSTSTMLLSCTQSPTPIVLTTTVTLQTTSTISCSCQPNPVATITTTIAVQETCTILPSVTRHRVLTTQHLQATVTTTVTVQRPSECLPSPSSTSISTTTQLPADQKSNTRSENVPSTTLGVITGILLLILIAVTAGWVWTYCVMRRRLTEKSSPTAVRLQRYTADKHQQPHSNTFSSKHPIVELANEDYAEVADRLATIHTRYLHREQQPVPRQGRKESTKPLIEKDYKIQEQSREGERGVLVDHDYQVLEHPDEEAQEGETENHYHVLECETKPSANGETETAATAAALYEVPVASKIKSKNTCV